MDYRPSHRNDAAKVKHPVQPALVGCTIIWCLAIVAVPLLDLTPVYLFFSTICHQIPSRSWHIYGEPLGLCIRCTAISFGFLSGLLVLRAPNVRWLKIAIAITAGEWLLSAALVDLETLRVVSGLLLGSAAAPIVRAGIEEMFMRVRTAHESM
jgi:uncharacterized membrane protein